MYIVSATVGLLLFFLYWLKRRYEYWTSRGIYQVAPTWFLGNLKPVVLGQKSFGELITDLYKEIRTNGHKVGGVYYFTSPVLIPVQPELVKQIMTTDFQHFNSHNSYVNEEADPLSLHLFNLGGSRWKSLRTKLTPTFTSGKTKMMFNTVLSCTKSLEDVLSDHATSGEVLDVKDVLGRFTTDVVGSCAFGLDCNSLKDPNTEFRKIGRRAFENGRIQTLKLAVIANLPTSVTKFIGLSLSQEDITKFFLKIINETIRYREDNNIVRKDFMHLLLQLKNRGKVTDEDEFKAQNRLEAASSALTINEIAAQAFLFFSAGFETSSATIAFALFELAQHQDIQDDIRNEINDVLKKHKEKITYEAVAEMQYLDRVVHETLRLHSPVVAIPRGCTKDWKIPGTDVTITEGTTIQIPILGLHMDPEYYENPTKFDPERFTEENKKGRPFAFLPFGEGPRICIALKFGLLQAKLGLISVIKNFKVTMNEKTALPIQMDPNNYVNTVKGGIWLNVTKV